ncbi:hypothetical protein OOU_Y34scaffold00540g8 [Pyricularia oryzae Y34]|uniref:Uncharacterized protein n=3 Tax=Pyricularia oryzae TaxID=318829 RepID=A0A4P7NRR8_PYROR|nr:hypothetical protein OOU_Y34scaffold00540g8 [Pyricularia oryzae Y34]QBZ64516.1 hypothetical protein PoMZ_06214 [Pyricularia oryzae]
MTRCKLQDAVRLNKWQRPCKEKCLKFETPYPL